MIKQVVAVYRFTLYIRVIVSGLFLVFAFSLSIYHVRSIQVAVCIVLPVFILLYIA